MLIKWILKANRRLSEEQMLLWKCVCSLSNRKIHGKFDLNLFSVSKWVVELLMVPISEVFYLIIDNDVDIVEFKVTVNFLKDAELVFFVRVCSVSEPYYVLNVKSYLF